MATVSAKALNQEADSIERDAKEALPSWVILGQTDKYVAAMERAAKLRKAAGMSSIAARREFLGCAA